MTKPTPIHIAGLRARAIRPPLKGSDLWAWRVERKGTEETLWTGRAPRAEVEAIVARLVVQPAARTAEGALHVRTVGDLLRAWWEVEELRPLAPDTLRLRKRSTERLLGVGVIEATPTGSLSRVHVLAYVDHRRRAGLADSTIGLDLQALGLAWRWGAELGLVAGQLPKVQLSTAPVRDRRTPTAGEVAAVLEHLAGWPRMAVLILWGTGIRLGELAGLRWADVDLGERPSIRVSGKTGARGVPLAPELVDELQAWQATSAGSRVIPVSYSGLQSLGARYIPRAAALAGVKPWTAHGFRRAVVDRLARAGVDVSTAASITGHSPQVMLQHYRQVTDLDRAKAVEAAQLGRLPRGEAVDLNTERKRRTRG